MVYIHVKFAYFEENISDNEAVKSSIVNKLEWGMHTCQSCFHGWKVQLLTNEATKEDHIEGDNNLVQFPAKCCWTKLNPKYIKPMLDCDFSD